MNEKRGTGSQSEKKRKRLKGPFRILEEKLSRAESLKPGLYQFQIDRGGIPRKFHLRVEPDGKGILAIDASRILHLNETATEYVMMILQGADDDTVVRRIRSMYRVSRSTALGDLEVLRGKINAFAEEWKVCPVTYLDVGRIEPFSTPVSAPYRMDLALTYRCQNSCLHCYLERSRDFPEMDTASWKRVIDKVFDIGIPHVVFTGGEATLRDDLVELVEYAENIGLVTGLLTNGRNLAKDGLMEKLSLAGLDHVQITIESHIPEIHERMTRAPGSFDETVEGIRAAVESPVYSITNTTITAINRESILGTVDFLHGLGIEVFALNGIIYTGGARGGELGLTDSEMREILAVVLKRALDLNMRLIWYTPTRYCELDPVALGLGPKCCTAAKYNMCIEPNGDVIPCQSYYEPLGNILQDPWVRIWDNPLSVSLRNHEYAPEDCLGCETFDLCGASCPLAVGGGELLCFESKSSG